MKKNLFKSDKLWQRVLARTLFWIGLFLFTTIMFLFLKPYLECEGVRNGVIPQCACGIVLAIIVVVGIILFIKKKLTFERVLLLLFLIAYVVSLTYMLDTTFSGRQHDTCSYSGHEGYAFVIYSTGKLPVTNEYQFYHPCLNAAVQAGFMQIMKPILELTNSIFGRTVYDLTNMFSMPYPSYPYPNLYFNHNLYMTTQILAVMYSAICSYFICKLVYRLKISKSAKLVGISFGLFFPRLYQLAAQENNDMLCIMFAVIALYYTYVFYKNRSWFSITAIALSLGLSMNSKLSGGTVALSIAVIFIMIFVVICKTKEKRSIWRIISQFCVFLIICGGIGLWFQVYAKIRFNQPFGYVWDGLSQDIYVGDKNAWERFINIFNLGEYFGNFFAAPYDDYNLPEYLIKTAIFGEFSYWNGEGFAFVAKVANYVFVISSIVLFVIYFIKSGKEQLYEKIFAGSIIVFQLLCTLYFNIKMPYGCTMDFRYIVPILPGFAVLMALCFDKFAKKEHKILRWVTYGVTISMVLMLGSSSVFYMMCI